MSGTARLHANTALEWPNEGPEENRSCHYKEDCHVLVVVNFAESRAINFDITVKGKHTQVRLCYSGNAKRHADSQCLLLVPYYKPFEERVVWRIPGCSKTQLAV